MPRSRNGYHDLDFAKVDLQRAKRRNFAEVIYADGKTAGQIVSIARTLKKHGNPVLITKLDAAKAAGIRKELPWLEYHRPARMATGAVPGHSNGKRPRVLVLTAGTADIPVAEEALVTLKALGIPSGSIFDVGVAGLHRLLSHLKKIRGADVLIVVAGMDGALPSVVSGLVSCPVIAVPTSAGYGASYKGIGALLTMLNSCSPGVAVVNIDNGFGAGYLAAVITRGK
jgi:NCAIR mutase (PurE)-related protein